MGQSAVLFWNRGGNMWLAKNTSGKRKESTEYSGNAPVSSICARSGEHFAVGACEYRRLPYCAPYGIYTRPAQGEDLMILSAQSGDVCLGVVSQPQEELLPGEILLKSSGGASIRLCNDGTILLNGKKVE